jgi:hypothetical protein
MVNADIKKAPYMDLYKIHTHYIGLLRGLSNTLWKLWTLWTENFDFFIFFRRKLEKIKKKALP